MKKTLFLTIIAVALAVMAVLLFTTGCARQPDAKAMQNSAETTTASETTAKKVESTFATKPAETIKSTTAQKEEKESQTEKQAREPLQELNDADWVYENSNVCFSDDQPDADDPNDWQEYDEEYGEDAFSEDEDSFDDVIDVDPEPLEYDDYSYENITPGKDHDSQAIKPDYDPMLFNDKERSRYESCDHEWVEADWGTDPDGNSHIVVECSKCHVTLNQWLYNGYSE